MRAGHPAAIVIRRRGEQIKVERLEHGGTAIGWFCPLPETYESGVCWLNRGDILLIFTDGITDAVTKYGTEFGVEGILNAVNDTLTLDLRSSVAEILHRTENGVGDDRYDDKTVLMVRMQ